MKHIFKTFFSFLLFTIFFSQADTTKGARPGAAHPGNPAYPVTFNSTQLATIQENTCKILEKVCEIIDEPTNCQKCDVSITNADVPLTIAEPGVYCLCEDIQFAANAAITIASNCVTLCMQQHAIDGQRVGATGVVINGGLENVTVVGGTIKNTTGAGIASNGNDSTSVNVVISDINFSNITGGFAIDFDNNATMVDLDSFLVNNSRFVNTNGINIQSLQGVVQKCIMEDTVPYPDPTSHSIILAGLAGALSENLVVQDCILSNGGGTISFSNAKYVQVENCNVENVTGNGFDFTNVEHIVAKNCQSKNCPEYGFYIFNDMRDLTGAEFDNCGSYSCGMDIATRFDGFHFEPAGGRIQRNIALRDCISYGHRGLGFDFFAESPSRVVNVEITGCIACSNERNGFNFDRVDNLSIDNSIAKTNEGRGVTILRCSNVSLYKCRAISNDDEGISSSLDTIGVVVIGCESCENGDQGFDFEGNDILVRDCIAKKNMREGFRFSDDSASLFEGFSINNCYAEKNVSAGFVLQLAANGGELRGISFENCVAQSNGDAGFMVRNLNSNNVLSDLIFKDCIAQRNQSGGLASGDGFIVGEFGTAGMNQDIIFDHCVAQGNANDGFRYGSEICKLCLVDCIAKDNGNDGFEWISTMTMQVGKVEDCEAIGNAGFGFNHATAPLAMAFIGNSAGGNVLGDFNIVGGAIPLHMLDLTNGELCLVDGDTQLTRWSNVQLKIGLCS